MALISKLTAIAEAIRSKTETTDLLTLDEMPSAIEGIQSGGRTEYLSLYGRSLVRMFEEVSFPDGTELVIEMPNFGVGNSEQMMLRCFNNATGLKSIKLKCNDNGLARSFVMAFAGCRTVETIDLSEFPVRIMNASQLFNYCESLVEIICELDITGSGCDYAFNFCKKLKEVRFKSQCIGNSISFNVSTMLSDASIQSIIDGLATVETAKTIAFAKVVKDKLTEAQISQITSKNWTLA